jgi:hypothetical protein
MRIDYIVSRALAPMTLTALLTACSDGGPASPVAEGPGVAQVTLTAPVSTLQLGDSTQLVVTVLGTAGEELTGRSVEWSSGNPSVLQVSGNGMVVGIGAGSASVTATVEGRSANVSLTVHPWNIAENVSVVDSTSLLLVSDSAELAGGRLRFQVLQAPAPTFPAGTIVVGTQNGGFLRRVTSSSAAGSEILLETGPAAVADAVQAGGFETSIDLIFSPGIQAGLFSAAAARLAPGEVLWGAGEFTYLTPGLRVSPRAAAAGVRLGPEVGPRSGFGTPDLMAFDLSGLDVCEILKVAASAGGGTCPTGIKKLVIQNGRLDFEPDMELKATFSGFSLETFRGVVEGALTLDLLLHAEVAGALGSFEAKPKLFTFTRTFLAMIGGFPVVGYVQLEVTSELSLKATAKGSMDAGFQASGSVEVGAEYNGGWSPVVEGTGSFEPRIPSLAEGTLQGNIELEAKVAMKPRAQVIFYGVVGPFAEVEPFGTATLSFGTTCGLKTNMAINAAFGMTIPFLDSKVSDFGHSEKPWIQGPQSDFPCPLGALVVTTTTGGENLPLGGYRILVDGGEKATVSPTDQHTIEFVEPGERQVTLAGAPANCSVQGGATQTVTVEVGGAHPVNFNVQCTALTGEIEVTTITGGGAPDPDGYVVAVDGGGARSIGTNDVVVFEDVAAGLRVVTLSDVASNCSVEGGSMRDVQVSANTTTAVVFSVTCSASELVVRTSTAGPPASSVGWTVTLDDAHVQSISPNGQVTFSTTPGQHNVRLGGLPGNCEPTGPNPVVVDVGGGGAEHTFQVECQSAGLTVTVATDGDPDPATGYTVHAGDQSQAIGIDGSVSFSDLPQGSVSVHLDGLPGHCTVQGLNPRSVGVPGSTHFEVVCQAPVECEAFEWSQFANPSVHVQNRYEDGGLVLEEYVAFGSATASVTAAATHSSAGVSLYWNDWLAFIPVDESRIGDAVTVLVSVDVAGQASNTDAVFGMGFADAEFLLSVYLRVDHEGIETMERSEVASRFCILGQECSFPGSATARVLAGNGGPATATASAKFVELIEVRDGNNHVVPIKSICVASGTAYPGM